MNTFSLNSVNLNEIDIIISEVVISPPDMREGYEETDDETTDEVVKFWQKMMKRYGSEEEYTKQLINQFKHGSEPEILIVVDKLLTGFDAPRRKLSPKQAVNEIDDYLYDELKTERGIELSFDQMDDIIEKVLQVAKHRSYK